MNIFSLKIYKDKDGDFEGWFYLELIQQQALKQLDGYYFTDCYDPPYTPKTLLPERLIKELKEWNVLVANLDAGKRLFLTIGIFDECVSGFYLINENDYVKVQFGSIIDWGYLHDRSTFTHFLDESILNVEFDFEMTKEDFLQDILENIAYLEKQKTTNNTQ